MTVRIGLIGSGLRVTGLAGYLQETEGLAIHGLYDPADASVRAAMERLDRKDIRRYGSWQALDEKEPNEIRFDDFHDAHLEGYQKVHAEGDRTLVEELADSMLHGTPPQCSGREGLLSAVTGIAVDRAREEGRVFDLDPVWEELGVRPSSSR